MVSNRTADVVAIRPAAQQAMQGIMRELQHEFIKRDDQIEALIVATLAGHNILAYGEPGTGKTMLLKAFSQRFPGSRLKRQLMDRQLDKAELFGGPDIKLLRETGEYRLNTRNTIFEADFLYLDEAEKTGPGVTTSLLTAINEGEGDDGAGWQKLDLIITMASVNSDFEPGQEAFKDRFLVVVTFDRLTDPADVYALLESKIVSRAAENPTTLDIDELRRVIDDEVPTVEVPLTVLQEIVAINSELSEESIYPSNRRLADCVALVKAHAWLHGRTVATEDDLVVLRHALFDTVEHQQKVAGIVLSHTGPVTRTALNLFKALAGMERELTKAGELSDGDRAAAGGRFQHDVGELQELIDNARDDAAGLDQSKLDEVEQALKEFHARIFIECMNTPVDRARRQVGLA